MISCSLKQMLHRIKAINFNYATDKTRKQTTKTGREMKSIFTPVVGVDTKK